MQTPTSQQFNSFDELYTYLEEDMELSLESIETIENELPHSVESDITCLLHDDNIIIGAYSHDSLPLDFWEDFDYGEFHIFDSKSDFTNWTKKVRVEKKLAYLVDRYEHSGVDYFIHGTRSHGDNNFDTSSHRAIYIPSADIQEEYKKMRRKVGELEAFQHFVETSNKILSIFSDYANGETYLNHVWVFNKEGDLLSDITVSGSIGHSHAESSQEDLIQETIHSLHSTHQSLAKSKM